jgi:hypothetical protein
MSFHKLFFALLVLAVLLAFTNSRAAQQSEGLPDGPGRDLLMSRCFQCHGEAMWKDQRLERRGWEATLYRMVGRGALWTEINAMASYLGTALAPQTDKAPK